MQVRDLPKQHFPGWARFRAALDEVHAADALTCVRRLTLTLTQQQDGTFEGLSPVFPMNIHPIVKEWVLKLSNETAFQNDSTSEENMVYRVLKTACLQINDLREEHDALKQRIQVQGAAREDQRFRKLWFHHLEQIGATWSTKVEMGRSQRMFVEIWTALQKEDRIQVKGLEHTAFLDPSNRLLVIMALWSAGGSCQDVRDLLNQTQFTEAQISTLLEANFPTLQSVQENLRESAQYPISIQNIFHRYPIVRVGDWGLIAPLPHLMMQWWDLQNLFETLQCTIENSTRSDGGAEFYRALGVVTEEYIHDLLREIASLSEKTDFVAPFQFLPGHESPDGFLHDRDFGTLVFESKCYRVPQRQYQIVALQDLRDWFDNLLGKNQKGRLPLRQGLAFFEQWQTSNEIIAEKLPGSQEDRSIYVIVSYEDIPFFFQWNRFRAWYGEQLGVDTHALWAKTLVISIRDLETLTAAGRTAGTVGGPDAPFSLFTILTEYLRYRNTTPDLEENGEDRQIKHGVGQWVVHLWPAVRSSEPQIIEQARDRLFKTMQEAGFPQQ